jgi:uroporphyrinogen decarboxylase
MTPHDRMLTAYRRGIPDTVPVSPELWYDIPLAVTGVPFEEVALGTHPLWKVQLDAHRFFGSDAWIVAFPGASPAAPPPRVSSRRVGAEELEISTSWDTRGGTLTRVTRNTPGYYDWAITSPVADFERDMPGWEEVALPPPYSMDLADVTAAIAGTGPDGLVTAFVGKLFFDFVASAREGGSTQAVYDFADHESTLRALHERYVAWMAEMADSVLRRTPAEVLFVENGYSSLGIESPALYRRWDLPVVRAVADVARRKGALLHVHQHGPCAEVLGDLAAAGVSLVDPLERPPGGDITDLTGVKRRHGGRLALRGNIHAHEVLLRGTVCDVDRQVQECIEAAAAGGGYILATGDGAILGTPFENIRAMVETARRCGRYA